jgi:glycosyltransferase involved in cell wall biosynthesis
MRVALVIYGELDQTTGGYLYDRKLVDYLKESGDHVDILSIDDMGYFRNLLSRRISLALEPSKLQDYDALIIDELCHTAVAGLIPKFARSTCTLGLVHHLKCSEPQGRLIKKVASCIEKRFLDHVFGLICNSQTTAESCNFLTNKDIPSCVAKPATVSSIETLSEDEIKRRALHTGPVRIMFLGTVTPRKGLHYLLQALNQVDSDMQLTIIGSTSRDPDYANRCRELAKGVSRHNPKFLNEVDQARVLEELSQSDILAVPSDYEGYGIAYLEGFSAGLPCIATAQGAPQEFVRDDENGFLIEPGDTAQLAQRLDTLATDRTKLMHMSLNARRTFAEHPSWQESFAKARDFIKMRVDAFRATDA